MLKKLIEYYVANPGIDEDSLRERAHELRLEEIAEAKSAFAQTRVWGPRYEALLFEAEEAERAGNTETADRLREAAHEYFSDAIDADRVLQHVLTEFYGEGFIELADNNCKYIEAS